MNFARHVYGDSPPRRPLDLEAIKHDHPLHQVVQAAGVKLQRSGQEWKGCCPFHADKTPSFTIYSEGKRFQCFGCGEQGDVLDFVMRQYGLADLYAAAEHLCGTEPPRADRERPKASSAPPPGPWVYTDPQGNPVRRKVWVGQDGKKYCWESFTEAGQWVRTKGDAPAVPYRLADLLQIDSKQPLFTTEGEKHADHLAAWGLLATSHRDDPAALAPYVAGRRVLILPDNDTAGEKYAEKMANIVRVAGGDAFIIRLNDLPPGGDVLDWSGDRAAIERLVDEQVKTSEPDALPILDLAELAKSKAQARRFAVERIAPVAEVTLFTGAGSGGKSLFAQQLATCSAASLGHCLGLAVQPGPSMYITCEDGTDQLHWVEEHVCKKYDLRMADLAGHLHLVSLRGELDNALGTFDSNGILRPSATFERIARAIENTGSHLVFLDNVGHLYTGNENDRGQVTQFVNLLNRLAERTGAAIIVLGHPSKASKPGERGHEYSGSTAWLNAVRSQFNIEHDLETDLRRLTLGKANYAQKGAVAEFRWHDFAFWQDDELPTDTAAEYASLAKVNAENSVFLRCLAAATDRKKAVSENPGVNYYGTVFPKMPEGRGYGKAAFERAFERLLAIRAIELDAKLWQRENRAWKYGIRAVEKCTDPCTDQRTNPLHQPAPTTSHRPARTDPPIDKSITGAANWAAAPDEVEVGNA